jgi:LysR family transcriptional activator of nhaA
MVPGVQVSSKSILWYRSIDYFERFMHRLNYHHLLYFWTVAREGTIARAGRLLHLTQPTISGQLRTLERAVGAKLFRRSGRTLALTDVGRVVFRYAEIIFATGRELQGVLEGRSPAGIPKLAVGVSDTLPDQVAFRLLAPVLRLPTPVAVDCARGTFDHLISRLAVNALDVVLTDAPVGPATKVRAYNHLLGECGVSVWGTAALARRYRPGFPKSLDGAPVLLPAEGTALRRSLERWFDEEGIRPVVRGEFADPGILKEFGRAGAGLFAVRTAVEAATRKQYRVHLVGRVESVREQFYAVSGERKLKHPAVVAICREARDVLAEPTV